MGVKTKNGKRNKGCNGVRWLYDWKEHERKDTIQSKTLVAPKKQHSGKHPLKGQKQKSSTHPTHYHFQLLIIYIYLSFHQLQHSTGFEASAIISSEFT